MDHVIDRNSEYYFLSGTEGFKLQNDNDTLEILNGAIVGCATGDGVRVVSNNNIITNDGEIAGAGGAFAGVDFQNTSAGTLINNPDGSILGGTGVNVENSGKTVTNHGDVNGFVGEGVFIDENVAAFSLTNDGHIFGYQAGVYDFGGSATIVNTGNGVIQSDWYGFELDGNSANVTNGVHATISGSIYSVYTHELGSLVLTNLGTLNGDVLCNVPIADNAIVNRGTINGNVIFAAGGATFTDAGLGHVTGAIVGGTGGDTFIAGRAKERFSAGTGPDIFVFNAVLFSPTGAKHDVIANFSHFFLFNHHHAGGDRIDVHAIDADITHAGHQHFVFIGTDTFAHYHSLHPGVVGILRFAAGAHQLQGTVNGDFAGPDFVVGLPGLAALHATDLILA
jgi:hypothetical protein